MTGRGSQAGGVLLALCIVGGAILGVALGQPTIGVLAGTGTGVALAVILWLVDRRRRGL